MSFVANDTVLGETLAEARALARSWLLWAGLGCAAIVAGLTGPFGTYSWMPVPMRLVYWAAVIFTTYWIGLLASFAMEAWVESLGLQAPWSIGLGAGAASLGVTLWLAAMHAVVLAAPFAAEFFRLLPYVAVIALALTFLFEAIDAKEVPVREVASNPAEPDWLDRLPPELGRELLFLQAQDHYLRARTRLGETLVRGTISEATKALGDYGMRVHRSWWVSRSAIVTRRSRRGGRVFVLSSGDEVPIGRSYWRKAQDLVDRV